MSSRSSKEPKGRAQQRLGSRERVAAMRREEEQRDRRQRRLIVAATGFVLALTVGGVAWGIINERDDPEPDTPLPTVVADGRETEPPWSLPADPVPLAENAGLQVEPMEGTAAHFHAHLDVIVNGEPVVLPANLGIHPAGTAMSELHTHDERGVLHVEAPERGARYTLGQVFAQWDVRLDEDGIGGLEADESNTLRAYVDGKLVSGDPADIELLSHRQIALVYGPPDEDVDVPDSFDFAEGE
ncbi:hypothetical protein [Phytoactinopolyspora endophytica]|uniref:hypothetical protein n=1 Tax=Phytoactinopolyspora endophytica TaxID=1642495 RepID=UPI00197BA411|nr:hypothetical protein [Phytoactinopolyspora endophytica]